MNEDNVILAMNAAYYQAFRSGDGDAMAALWAHAGATCIHPGWRPLTGRESVVASYRDIFANAGPTPIACTDEQVIATGDFARVICIERIGRLALAATNCFVRTQEGWKMVHHQASPMAKEASSEPAPRRVLN
jgi:ketosteroid isomerase-like protein